MERAKWRVNDFATLSRRSHLAVCPPRFHPARRVRLESAGVRNAGAREGVTVFRLPAAFQPITGSATRIWSRVCRCLTAQVAIEPGQRALPGERRSLPVVSRRGVVVETMLRSRVDVAFVNDTRGLKC